MDRSFGSEMSNEHWTMNDEQFPLFLPDLAGDRGGEILQLPAMKIRGLMLIALLFVPQLRAATLEEVIADPRLWPAEVTVNAMTKATQIRNGQPAGMLLVGAGKKLAVTALAADGVTGKLGGSTVKVPLDKTDLLQRLDVPAAPVAVEEAPPAEEPAAAPAAAPAGAMPAMHRRLSGKLVQLSGSTLQPVPDSRLAGVKYFGLYYSASWCGPCREFTPGFVNAYRQLKQKHPEFEVVFISADNSGADMRDYMKEDRMPWTALKYDLRERNPELLRYSGPGIPCLVLVDAAGRVLADSYRGDDYLGPGHVLQETARILGKGR
jgi:nucleoredoxin